MEMMTIDDLAGMMAGEFSSIADGFAYMHEQFAFMHQQFDYMHKEFTYMHEQFDTIDSRFDRVEYRVVRIEEAVEDHTGKLIGIDDRLSRIEYTLDEANPRKLQTRVENLEKKTFGSIQAA